MRRAPEPGCLGDVLDATEARCALVRTYAKNATQALVLATIRRLAPVTRAEIARHAELAPATVSHVVGPLVAGGLVEELGRRSQRRGQPPIELRIRARAAFTLGLHLEHSSITGVAADLDGTILHEEGEALEDVDPERVLLRLADTCERLLVESGLPRGRFLGIGLACFGPLDLETGTVAASPFSDAWCDVPLRARLAEAAGLPVYLDNNATSAAIGEHWYGAAQGLRDFFHVFIGVGIGGGLFLNGRVHRGISFNAGEAGHVVVDLDQADANRDPLGRDRARTLEACASLDALRRALGAATARDLAGAFARRDAALLGWLDRAAARLAQAVVSIDALLDLEAVVIGGLLPEPMLDHLLQEVDTRRSALTMPGRPHHAELLAGSTQSSSAARGAAMLPVYDAFLLAPGVGPTLGSVFSSPPTGGDALH